MKFRVHYTTAKLRGPQTTEIGAETKGAAAVAFNHHFPGSNLTRIEQIGGPAAPTKPAAPVVTVTTDDRPMTDADRENCIQRLQSMRERLRAMPAPLSQPSVAQLGFELRDRNLRGSKA